MSFLGDLLCQQEAAKAVDSVTVATSEGTLLQALVEAVSAHVPAEPADSAAVDSRSLLAALQVTVLSSLLDGSSVSPILGILEPHVCMRAAASRRLNDNEQLACILSCIISENYVLHMQVGQFLAEFSKQGLSAMQRLSGPIAAHEKIWDKLQVAERAQVLLALLNPPLD